MTITNETNATQQPVCIRGAFDGAAAGARRSSAAHLQDNTGGHEEDHGRSADQQGKRVAFEEAVIVGGERIFCGCLLVAGIVGGREGRGGGVAEGAGGEGGGGLGGGCC